MGFFSDLIDYADPISAQIINDQADIIGVDTGSTNGLNNDALMQRADPISASIITDQGEALGYDVGDSHAIFNAYDPYEAPAGGGGASFNFTDPANQDVLQRLDKYMADWRSRQTPAVTWADDPRHEEMWKATTPYVADWRKNLGGKVDQPNALAAPSVQKVEVQGNALAPSVPGQSGRYGGINPGGTMYTDTSAGSGEVGEATAQPAQNALSSAKPSRMTYGFKNILFGNQPQHRGEQGFTAKEKQGILSRYYGGSGPGMFTDQAAQSGGFERTIANRFQAAQ